MLKSILLLKFRKIYEIANHLIEKINLRERYQTIYDLSMLVFTIICLAHFFGCCFVYLAKAEINYYSETNTWLSVN